MKRNLLAGRLRSGGLSLNVFTEAELEDIHLATLEVLERTGVFVEADEALDLFADGGCARRPRAHVVRIPPHVVEDAIRSAPSTFVLCGREAKNDIVLEPGRVGFTNFSEGIRVVDPRTGELREPTKADIADIARLNDYLSDIDTLRERRRRRGRAARDAAPLHNAEAQYSEHHQADLHRPAVSGIETVRTSSRWRRRSSAAPTSCARRPIVYIGVCPVSPLKLLREATEVIIESARWVDPPTTSSRMAMAGGSSPVTLAGTLVTHNAEVLAGITLAQLTERGAPCIYGSSTTAMDLRLASACVGSPERAMISAAVAQMARRYLLPSFVAGA